MFFRSYFRSTVRKSKKSTQEAQQDAEGGFLELVSGCPQPPGERKREGNKSLGLHKELGLSDSPFVIDLGVSESDVAVDLARFAHLRWAAD